MREEEKQREGRHGGCGVRREEGEAIASFPTRKLPRIWSLCEKIQAPQPGHRPCTRGCGGEAAPAVPTHLGSSPAGRPQTGPRSSVFRSLPLGLLLVESPLLFLVLENCQAPLGPSPPLGASPECLRQSGPSLLWVTPGHAHPLWHCSRTLPFPSRPPG